MKVLSPEVLSPTTGVQRSLGFRAREADVLPLPPLPIPRGLALGRGVGLRRRALFVAFVLFVLADCPAARA